MHKFLSLTRVTFKNTFGAGSDGTSKRRNTALIYLVLLVCMLPMVFLLYILFTNSFAMMNPLDQSGSVLAISLHLLCFIIFFFSIFMIPSIFYFSKDGETLLSLPLIPEAILGSKFIVCLLYEYVVTLLVLTPTLLAYFTTLSFSFLQVVMALVIFLLVPIFPLVLSLLISMLVMRFVPFFKNRDRFNLIAGIVSVVLALGLSFSLNSFSTTQDPNVIMNALMSGDNSLIQFLGYCFPTVSFASRAFVNVDFISLLIFIGITVLSLVVCMFLGKILYFKGLIGFSETSSSRKKLSSKELGKLNTKKNRVLTYTMKELKLLFRTPSYFLNCISTTFIFPILMLLLPMLQGDSFSLIQIPADFTSQLADFWPYFIMGGIALGIFLGNLNLISSTSISREGTNYSFMKYIPMPLKDQIHAKALSGILISILADIAMIVTFYFVFPIFPISFLLLVFVSSLVTIVLSNYIGICIDILHPKLIWEQEATAVKQNMSGMISMLGGMGIAIAVGLVAAFIPQELISYIAIGIVVLLVIVSFVLFQRVGKIAQKAMEKYGL